MMMKMLIVEDELTSRLILSRTLSPFGHVDVVVDGNEALEAISYALKERKPYQLITLDIKIPFVDGLEVLAQLRIREKEAGLSETDKANVIMMTASGDTTDMLSAFSDQCAAYLVKPVDKNKLLDLLRSFQLIPPQSKESST